MFFLKRDFYIQKLDEFKQCTISEERMFKNYFLIKSLKDYVFDFNSKKGFDFFNGEEISGSSVLNNLNFINNVKSKNILKEIFVKIKQKKYILQKVKQ